MSADRCMGLNKHGSIVIHIATDYTSGNTSHIPTCHRRSARFDGQVFVNYYESDQNESDEVVDEVESEKQVDKDSSVIWASKRVAARTGGVKVGPAGSLNVKNIDLI
ncbi:hypothetical protein BDD12DRAFT_891706 [Trichophaea hybrida]|nr:hypothetical protein BDD12DRAFT_891706 [Trichophaea hybrida]